MTTSVAAPSRRPRLRGVLHQYAAAVAFGGGVVLVAITPVGAAAWAVAVFVASLVLQFAVSAVLHRGRWTQPTEAWLRRVDHASIFVLIAGTYTPFASLGLPDHQGLTLLAMVWSGATLGILYCLLNVRGPKQWRALGALALGWSIAPYIGDIRSAYGDTIFGLLFAGGCLYSVGAIIYTVERPALWPSTFGFHEAFHALTVAAAALHFAGVFSIVAR